jgi:hypothetical protein
MFYREDIKVDKYFPNDCKKRLCPDCLTPNFNLYIVFVKDYYIEDYFTGTYPEDFSRDYQNLMCMNCIERMFPEGFHWEKEGF